MEFIAYCFLSTCLGALGLSLVFQRRQKRARRRQYWVRPWLQRCMSVRHPNVLHLYRELLVDGDVAEFRATLRMTPEVYFGLLDKLRKSLSKQHTNFRRPISPEARLALSLRYLALGDSFRSLSQLFSIGLSTTRAVLQDTCMAIATVLGPDYLQTPTTKKDWIKIAEDFESRWDFPHCIGCVDGKHIRIIAPRNSGSFFYNYKDYFSIVLMAVASSDYKFLYVDIGAEGKASDGGIWSKSSFNEQLMDIDNPLNIPEPCTIEGMSGRIPFFLVGDDAFKLGPNLMKPFPGTGLGLSKRQRIFNYRISRCRRIVENTFGILTCRFRIFLWPIEVNPEGVHTIVYASCSLHNYLREHAGKDYLPPSAVDTEMENGVVIPGDWRTQVDLVNMQKNSQRNASEFAKKLRNDLSHYFITRKGEVPWQYNKAIM